MFSGNKACLSTVFFFWEFQSAFRNVLGTPEALCEVRPRLRSFALETEALKCPVQDLKPTGSQQGQAWPPPGAARPFAVSLSLSVTVTCQLAEMSLCFHQRLDTGHSPV